MKKKYVLVSGLAFGEKADMRKLKKLAQQGWILDGITSFFYRFRKGQPQTLDYSVDYRSDYDDEYFTIFQEAGWTHRATLGEIHIFSAPEGTTPLYLDTAEQSEQYLPMIRETAKGSAISFLVLVILAIALRVGGVPGWLSHVLFVFLVFAWVVFVFNFMPCIGFLVRRLRMARAGQ